MNGWVRNCSDGSVEAQVEGDSAAVKALIDVMREGPPRAKIESVHIDQSDRQCLSGFDVRH